MKIDVLSSFLFFRYIEGVDGVPITSYDIVFCPVVLFSYCLSKSFQNTLYPRKSSLPGLWVSFDKITIQTILSIYQYLFVLICFSHIDLPLFDSPLGSFRTNKTKKRERDIL